jgi:hypothetical protein
VTNRKHKRLIRDYNRNQLQMYTKDGGFKAEIYQRQYDQKFVVSMSRIDPSLSNKEQEDILFSTTNQSIPLVWVTHSVHDTFEEAMKQVVME